MARTTSFLSQTSGKLDDQFQTRQTSHGTFLARNPRKGSQARRSEKQASTRCQMANAAANYTLYNGKLKEAFEGKNAGVSDFNAFIQVNYGKNPVYMTKQESQSGGCVLGNYQYSRGSLPAIGTALQGGRLVSGLKLGGLTVDAGTTVGALSEALIGNNADWQQGDQLTFFLAEQWMDSEGVPRVTMESWKLVLDSGDDSLLYGVVDGRGFASVNGEGFSVQGYVLGMSVALENQGASWVHSRNKSDGSTQVSTQRLKVVSDILADYQSYEAMVASAESYGGINSKDVYLNPGRAVTFGTLSSGSGGSGSSTTESSSTGQGGSTTGGGSESGGSGGTGGNGTTGNGNSGGNGGSGTESGGSSNENQNENSGGGSNDNENQNDNTGGSGTDNGSGGNETGGNTSGNETGGSETGGGSENTGGDGGDSGSGYSFG